MPIYIWVIVGILGVIFFWIVAVFNGLVKMRNRVKEAWADIEVQLKRRHNLIPNLIETVKGYAEHEKGVFEKVTRARTKALSAKNFADRAKAENALSNTLKTLFAVAENYPNLKANANFLELQRELSDTEDKIQAARRFYNSNVRDYNIKIQSFPSNLVARAFNFKKEKMFEVKEAAMRETPKVKF